jgi:C_GCAxxG_C_C family probable redox protein
MRPQRKTGRDRERLLGDVFESALKNLVQYSGCTQAVLGAVQEKVDGISKDVFKAANSLAGGVARQGETCGALLGAILAIGAVTGRENFEDLESYRRSMDLSIELFRRFKEEVGHTLCYDIQKAYYGRTYRLFIPEEREAFRSITTQGGKGCPEICGKAARMVAEMILDPHDRTEKPKAAPK